jgi:hypothetical protein
MTFIIYILMCCNYFYKFINKYFSNCFNKKNMSDYENHLHDWDEKLKEQKKIVEFETNRLYFYHEFIR